MSLFVQRHSIRMENSDLREKKVMIALPPVNKLANFRQIAGCYYLLKHYQNGEQIETNEPCLNCTCVNSMLMCYLRVCPFVRPLGERCIIEKVPGDCCPKITCPDGECRCRRLPSLISSLLSDSWAGTGTGTRDSCADHNWNSRNGAR